MLSGASQCRALGQIWRDGRCCSEERNGPAHAAAGGADESTAVLQPASPVLERHMGALSFADSSCSHVRAMRNCPALSASVLADRACAASDATRAGMIVPSVAGACSVSLRRTRLVIRSIAMILRNRCDDSSAARFLVLRFLVLRFLLLRFLLLRFLVLRFLVLLN